jgi:hypothetical protein
MRGSLGHLRVEWARQILYWWKYYNSLYLHEALIAPLIDVGDSKTYLGRWRCDPPVITISYDHIVRDSWLTVLDTLRHEMAHQYVDQVIRPDGETAHGPAFRMACKRLRCSDNSSRNISKDPGLQTNVMERVRKVLSLVDSPNEHEAQAAIQKVRMLLLKYNIDLVELDRERQFVRRSIGPIKRRHASFELWLAYILNEHFFVETIWAESYVAHRNQMGTVLEIYGTLANTDMASYVHDYLSNLLHVLWEDYRKKEGIETNKERQRYWSGVLQGFCEKMSNRDRKERSKGGDGRNIDVWNGDPQLLEFYHNFNPNVRVRRSGGVRQNGTYIAGMRTGQKVEIRSGIESRDNKFGGYLENV